MFIQTVRIVIPLVLLQFLTGCQSDDNDKLKSEIESLKQEISQLTKEVGKIEDEVKEMKDLAFNPPKKEPPTLPNQPNFTEDGTLPLLGSKDAKIAIIEFSDFQCPYCKRFTDSAFKQIKENYIDTGKVQYIARDFPLSFHAKAMGAAIAATCSLHQNSYWPMRDMLFSNVKDLGDELYQKAATDLSLNLEEFNKCMKDQSIANKVEQDLTLGKSLGIRGTPSFLIGRVENDQLVEPQIVVGAQRYAVFESLLEQLSNSDKAK
ncbi:TPA: DsbA family protein [Vibrio parahaemolyticus]|uniref:DsbA family protein n=2 Tax=Vibrio parahaemolyticus TaxID=670 RepID=UPI0011247D29|nr:thioredoxin domain-containing protein [Vibrio parahaemolyticus]TOB85950.1 thioredoxin [Vibrio parahaemolyticus]HCZ9680664.1 thioredoxin domain-containing protein [Vibrio parahaemolyticus]